jgi:Ca2+-transporting ATPase
VGAFSNLLLLAVVAFTAALQVLLQQVPAAAALFSLAPLGLPHLVLALALGFIPVSVLELRKLALRLRRR